MKLASADELEQIRAHMAAKPEISLDKPEQFLYDLSKILTFAERISCFMFQIEFDDSITGIGNILKDVKSKDSQITLLHFNIVRTYMKKLDSLLLVTLSVPELENIKRASGVNFDEVTVDLQKLQKNLDACENCIQKALEDSALENLQSFKI
ncbi:hypothetical protein ILUMI_11812 [Ignelater luminosus]|uniref:FH2 domain-containing protein n=1 Tax=Ignelater luminosus TaxID=2038154 RepID=A0A8K0G7D2_IGNLU|nr:hypothetical protein ILUMI_11812 [Ignelater luminosus]